SWRPHGWLHLSRDLRVGVRRAEVEGDEQAFAHGSPAVAVVDDAACRIAAWHGLLRDGYTRGRNSRRRRDRRSHWRWANRRWCRSRLRCGGAASLLLELGSVGARLACGPEREVGATVIAHQLLRSCGIARVVDHGDLLAHGAVLIDERTA